MKEITVKRQWIELHWLNFKMCEYKTRAVLGLWRSLLLKQIVGLSSLCLITSLAHADAFYKAVRYTCDRTKDQVVIEYLGTYDEVEGEKWKSTTDINLFDPWSLVIGSGDRISSTKAFRRTCILSDGRYSIDLYPVPGNYNVQGECGAEMAVSARIKRGKRILTNLIFEGYCHGDDPIVTKLVLKARANAPSVFKVPKDKFYNKLA